MNTEHTALLLIDLQRDFLADDGRLPIARDQVDGLIRAVRQLVEGARRGGIPVVHVVNHYPTWSIGNLFRKFAAIEGSHGAGMDERCPRPVDGEPTFAKSAGSAFHRPELSAWLKAHGIQHLVVGGVFANACVRQTCKSALAAGFDVSVVTEAVGAGSASSRRRGLRAITHQGGDVAAPDIFDPDSSTEGRAA